MSMPETNLSRLDVSIEESVNRAY